jgi:transcriptional regulator with XRE-family HTH domain
VPQITRSPSDDREAFVERLKLCQRRCGSQNALAKKAGISQSTLSGYIIRSTEPPRDIVMRLARAASVSVGWLVTGEGPVDPDQEVSSSVDVSDECTGVGKIAAAVAENYSVPFKFALSRLQGSEELKALGAAMSDGARTRAIPVVGTNQRRIWGVLTKEDLEKAAPGAELNNIEVYEVKMRHLKGGFKAGDWAIVDSSRKIDKGTYCLVPKGSTRLEVRVVTALNGQFTLNSPVNIDQNLGERNFPSEESVRRSFTVFGRLVGAIRFVAETHDREP